MIAGPTTQGYALIDSLKRSRVAAVSIQDKNLGSFTVEHGHVAGVEVQVYAGQAEGAIDLGEALYWIATTFNRP